MADIRIKDLTTTASSTASDDFIAVDGTTNGTRKLNAFSPTFGGNATVTGTLSSAGNLSVTGTSAQVILGQSSGSQLTYLIRSAQAGGAIQIVQDSATVNRWLSLGRADNSGVYVESMRLNDAGVVSISATTASTTTSTGALVVGNGTSGGLGVGGAINAGGEITVAGNLTITGNNSALTTYGYNGAKGLSLGLFARGQSGGWTTGLHFYSSNTDYSATWHHNPTTGDLTLYSNASSSNYASTDRALLINTSKQVQVLATTASTSTSSGALVVSGGVGVAGAIYGGGVINTSVGTGGVGNQLVLNNSATNATSGRGSAIVYTGTGDANLASIESQTATASNNTGKLVIKTSNAGTLAIAATYDENGNLIQKVNGTAPSLAVNSTMSFELTSNTSLKIFVRGSDGTTRSTTLTLA